MDLCLMVVCSICVIRRGQSVFQMMRMKKALEKGVKKAKKFLEISKISKRGKNLRRKKNKPRSQQESRRENVCDKTAS